MIVVVKLGTSVLTGGAQTLDRAHMVELVRQCALLQKNGHRVIVVTSGAVAAGRELLGFPHLPLDLPHKQMLAAIGQGQLVQLWQHLFGLYGLNVGQMLLTRADLEDRERFLNARDTLGTLLSHGVIPLINENDAVATNEIKVGDNDNLSARVAILAKAELLLLLTDQPGLFTADPRSNPHAELIAEVQTIDATLHKLAGWQCLRSWYRRHGNQVAGGRCGAPGRYYRGYRQWPGAGCYPPFSPRRAYWHPFYTH